MVIVLWAGACHKKAPGPVVTPAVIPPALVSPPAAPASVDWPELPLPPSRLSIPEPSIPRNFLDGESSFLVGNYAEAIQFYEKYIQDDPMAQYRDIALFRLGIAHMLACTAPACRARSTERSREQFKRLVSQYPQSAYSTEARLILSLQTEIERMSSDVRTRDEKIKKLSDELDQLKKIDLGRQPAPIKK